MRVPALREAPCAQHAHAEKAAMTGLIILGAVLELPILFLIVFGILQDWREGTEHPPAIPSTYSTLFFSKVIEL